MIVTQNDFLVSVKNAGLIDDMDSPIRAIQFLRERPVSKPVAIKTLSSVGFAFNEEEQLDALYVDYVLLYTVAECAMNRLKGENQMMESILPVSVKKAKNMTFERRDGKWKFLDAIANDESEGYSPSNNSNKFPDRTVSYGSVKDTCVAEYIALMKANPSISKKDAQAAIMEKFKVSAGSANVYYYEAKKKL